MPDIVYKNFDLNDRTSFHQVADLIDNDLSEPYSVYVYRYFLNEWPSLCKLAYDLESKTPDIPIGCIISKVDSYKDGRRIRGYIGMLVVKSEYRGNGIARKLIYNSIQEMRSLNFSCDEIMLETEVANKAALHLYESFGFIRTKRLYRYYLNKGDAFRLILPLTEKSCVRSTFLIPTSSNSSISNMIDLKDII
ncbi:peptide alpha-N-acetyltransferase MAK3 SCDLUD_000779 [Saccharomycodes ludwigii]|uniref:peptide alpha-N-acetyltransferase MAK3 n=1 Tax=Saccharomycodes ludwigii TaxID=36035 RepID=UPI001E8A8C50|nr:hypothetical protein SCDLUD_000779 [Saccharomycodes ludwigii]KAH3903165.1 hypothetical protein SCDLUD_000779 [Saccharomycodes ludwigii]